MNGSIGNISAVSPDGTGDDVSVHTICMNVVFAIIVILTSLVSNILVIIGVLSRRDLRTIPNVFVINLSICDLVIGLLICPMYLRYRLKDTFWPLDPVSCEIWVSLDVFTCTGSILTLVCIGVDRYRAVSDPLKYCRRYSYKLVALTLVLLWVVALTVALSIKYAWPAPKATRNSTDFCKIPPDQPELEPIEIYSVITSFYLPLAVLVFVYSRVYHIMHVRSKFWRSCMLNEGLSTNSGEKAPIRTHVVLRRSMSPSQDVAQSTTVNLFILEEQERRVAKTMGMVISCFVICWLPFFLIVLIKRKIPTEIIDLCSWLGYASSALNPIIYAGTSEKIRTAIISAICCRPPARKRLYNNRSSFMDSPMRNSTGGAANTMGSMRRQVTTYTPGNAQAKIPFNNSPVQSNASLDTNGHVHISIHAPHDL